MLPAAPPKLDLALTPTEFRPLDRLSEALGGPRIWLKSDDLTGSLVSGNKVRKLEYLLADAQAKGANTVITCGGMQSNHCRATAALAARIGMQCHLILRGPHDLADRADPYAFEEVTESVEGNLLLDVLCGAEISIYSPKYYALNLSGIFKSWSEQYDAAGAKAYAIPTGGSNGVGLWGYIAAAQELEADFRKNNISPVYVVCASGSGGTQGGLTLGLHLLESTAQVLGFAVCDSEAYFRNKIQEDIREWSDVYPGSTSPSPSDLKISTNDKYIGPGYARGYKELFEHIRWLARLEGVVLDPVYTGKAFYGMCHEVRNGQLSGCENIVFVHTGGIYGTFPFQQELVNVDH